MAPNPIEKSSKDGTSHQDASKRAAAGKHAPSSPAIILLYSAVVVALVAGTSWARRWLLSGAAILTLAVLLGDARRSRVFPKVPLWALLSAGNLAYAICSTSWLLYWFFTAGCYPVLIVTCLFQFTWASSFARRRLRRLVKQLHFINDKITLFNIPALEIDTDVTGLLVVRGLTFSTSTFTFVAHGIELGLKLADDMELAFHADEVTIPLFRRIEIGQVFGNLKGGKCEMTFGAVEANGTSVDDDLLLSDTPLLRAATAGTDGELQPPRQSPARKLTGGQPFRDASVSAGLESMSVYAADDEGADKRYRGAMDYIRESSAIQRCLEQMKSENLASADLDDYSARAALCGRLHVTASVPHPPKLSIRVTTLQNLTPPYMRRFLHRLPMLLRVLLAFLSYLHPIYISCITATASGRWATEMIVDKLFKHYTAENAELRRLEAKISRWLSDANFALQVTNVDATGQVPIDSRYEIITHLNFEDVMAHRILPEADTVKQVVRLAGADATFRIPAYLMPHHEHILPPKPTFQDLENQVGEIQRAESQPRTVLAEQEYEKLQKDEASVIMRVHASLPACLDQELLNFVAALVKATKVIEFEKEAATESEAASSDAESFDTEASSSRGIKNFARSLQSKTESGLRATKHGMKRATLAPIVNDRWIAKLVGKIAARLEVLQGDAGYSGAIPVKLDAYRPADGAQVDSKILA